MSPAEPGKGQDEDTGVLYSKLSKYPQQMACSGKPGWPKFLKRNLNHKKNLSLQPQFAHTLEQPSGTSKQRCGHVYGRLGLWFLLACSALGGNNLPGTGFGWSMIAHKVALAPELNTHPT